MEYKKKLIEVALPLEEINDASAYDKMPGIGPHPKGIHHWWARLPLPTARAVLFASVVDDPSSHPEKFPSEEAQNTERERLFGIVRDLMQKKLHEKPQVYAMARKEMLKHTDGKLPPMLDPFSGGGSIPLEAARLGFETFATDLNPVSVLLNKCNLELIPQWLDQQPVNPEQGNSLSNIDWTGANGLAEDVRYYGNLIQKRTIGKIGHLYPKVKLPKEYGGRETNVIAWIWARTVASPNPAVHGAHVPLIKSYWLSSKKENLFWLEPVIDKQTNTWHFEVKSGHPANLKIVSSGTKSGRGSTFTCLLSGAPIKGDYIQAQAKVNGLKNHLIAIVADTGRGRIYLPANSEHSDVVKQAIPKWCPEELLSTHPQYMGAPRYGMTRFCDLFTSRQLTAMATLSELIQDISRDVLNDARNTSLSENDAIYYAAAVTTFLALALDRCADFNNMLSTWKPSGQQQMHLFTRQAIPMVWDFAEANLLGEKAICWHNAVGLTVDAIKSIPISNFKGGYSNQNDAAGAENNTQGLLVSTDPPYYDNIPYSDLSDFFYVWLRRTLRDYYPNLFSTVLTPKNPELVASTLRHNGNLIAAKEHFESGFRKTFTTLREKMDARFPLTVYYAFKQEDGGDGSADECSEDNEVSSNGVDLTTGWETLLEALLGSGFQITATWPVRASQAWRMRTMGSNALASYIVLACRARPADAPQCTRRDFINTLKRELKPALDKLQRSNIAPVDLAQSAIGPGMSVYSRYSKVLEADGKPMSVRSALQIINQELDVYFNDQDGELDRDSRFCIDLYTQNAFNDMKFGQADVLARAKNTSVEKLASEGSLYAQKGVVRLLTREEIPKKVNIKEDFIWLLTQQLTYAMETGGINDCAEIIAPMVGYNVESAKSLAYRLFIIADRKGWAQEAYAYNALVTAWPDIQNKAAELQSRKPEQTTLFNS